MMNIHEKCREKWKDHHVKGGYKGAAVFWGLMLIAAAVLLLADEMGFRLGLYSISAWQVLGGVLCLSWIIKGIASRSFFSIFFPLAFLVMLFEAQIAGLLGVPGGNLVSNWILLLAALLLTIGFHVLFPFVKKFPAITSSACVTEKNRDKIENAMGAAVTYVDACDLGTYKIDNAMGKTEVFIENAEGYQGEGTIDIDNAMGHTLLHVPADWQVVVHSECAVGAVQNRMPDNPEGKVLHIHAECAVGCIEIRPI